MRKITKFMFALAVFVGGVTSADAQEAEDVELFDLTEDLYYNWTGYDETAIRGTKANAALNLNIELKQDQEGGIDLVYGNGNVSNTQYADLTGCTTMRFEGRAGTPLRVLLNRQEDNSLSEENPTIGENGTTELDLTKYTYVHLNAIKIKWGGSGMVTSIKLVKPKDPLALPKQQLKDILAIANVQSPLIKTPESFAVLTKAIEDANAALIAEDANVESLEAALKNLNGAIEGLELIDGYTNLTADMFYSWDGTGADATKSENSADGIVVSVNKSLSQNAPLAGLASGSVPYSIYADLTGYSKIVFVGTKGFNIRALLNREEGSGDGGDFIEKTATIGEDGIVEFNLTEMSYAHLNVVKCNYGDGIITGIYLYKTPTEITVKVNNGAGYRTFVSEYATDWSEVTGVTAYTATVTDNEVIFTKVDGAVPANTGLLLKAQDGTYTVPVAEEAGDVKSALVGVTAATEVPAGSFVLYNGNEGVGFYKTTAEFTVGANTAYIPATTSAARTFIALPGNETTGVNTVESVEATDGKFFDLQGRQMSKPTKGLYISNGKKYIVK